MLSSRILLLFTFFNFSIAFQSALVTEPKASILCASGSKSDADKLRETAKKLREEAKALQSEISPSQRINEENLPTSASCKSIPNSTWTLTYRFASDPLPEDDEEDRPVSNYSGKLTVKFLADGYTELISHEPASMGGSTLSMEKVWGWDKELSNEDELEYLLFSCNALLPSTDESSPNEVVRFYMQARVDSVKSDGQLSLAEGTVTMKKDVKPPGGFWGAFNGAGILAQFRYVGNFVAKPTSNANI
mmetsp:Transcript_22129/g.33448  ORF Transcript_22129/g.33448 Transcript_22129/m.33448 type:complete len:247 (+) Transcript_22129:247-987(+)